MEGSSTPAEKSYLRSRRHSSVALSLQATHLPPPASLPHERPLRRGSQASAMEKLSHRPVPMLSAVLI